MLFIAASFGLCWVVAIQDYSQKEALTCTTHPNCMDSRRSHPQMPRGILLYPKRPWLKRPSIGVMLRQAAGTSVNRGLCEETAIFLFRDVMGLTVF
ncbi:hypothetical protein ACVWZ9_005715 [Pseudomonas chlororaphis]